MAIAKRFKIPHDEVFPHCATLQYAKVVEFQLRGVVHFHALVRLVGPKGDEGFAPAPSSMDQEVLSPLIAEAAGLVRFTAPPALNDGFECELAFGSQIDSRGVRTNRRTDDSSQPLSPGQVAGYRAPDSRNALDRSRGRSLSPLSESNR